MREGEVLLIPTGHVAHELCMKNGYDLETCGRGFGEVSSKKYSFCYFKNLFYVSSKIFSLLIFITSTVSVNRFSLAVLSYTSVQKIISIGP
jgi:hypothetical protein